MPDEEDVIVDPSSTEDLIPNISNEDVVEEIKEPIAPSTQEVKDEVDDGRPDRNLLWENKRKIDELTPVIQSLKERLESLNKPVEQQPQYSKAQLRAFAESTEDANQKTWAYGEMDKIDKAERHNELKELFEGHTKKSQMELQRQQSANYVAQNFPNCFIKDANGNAIGWNNADPMTRKIGEYMQNPARMNSPDGLIDAAKLAAFDLGIGVTNKLQNKVVKVNAQLKREQKKQLISGSGSPAQQVEVKSKVAKLAAEYSKTKDPNAFRELIKARGLLPQ